MGNISQVIPSIQPHIGINCLPAVNHQPEFAAACVTPEADQAVLIGINLSHEPAWDRPGVDRCWVACVGN